MSPPARVSVLGSAGRPAPRCSRRRVWLLRAFSVAVVASALSFTALQASDCVYRYRQEPVITTRAVQTVRTLPLPALTLCNPSMDGMVLYHYGVSHGYPTNLTSLPWAEEGNLTIPIFLRQVFPAFDKSLADCRLLGRPCADLGRWQHRHTTGFGLCSTLVPDPDVAGRQVGDGFSIQYNHWAGYSEQDVGVQDGVRLVPQQKDARRLLVFLHARHEPFTPLPWVQQLTELAVQPGAIARARIELTIERRLSRRQAPCRSRAGYSRVRCLERCLSAAQLRAANASCRTIDMVSAAPLCATGAEYLELLSRYSQAYLRLDNELRGKVLIVLQF
ncbi:hypothetical protein FJT64_004986 [Amphibalanus amphitrite]|uniref:Uncharacterized protein n=1 Tax=Amphibalanus amphitrite TaxID=1232801 RepID=A0A6A4VV93_AMPAM|nr:hypothetical protein FJT64_004986 [Amphibalanus amphitrite]